MFPYYLTKETQPYSAHRRTFAVPYFLYNELYTRVVGTRRGPNNRAEPSTAETMWAPLGEVEGGEHLNELQAQILKNLGHQDAQIQQVHQTAVSDNALTTMMYG